MNFIVDASFALAWLMRDEATPETDKLLDTLGQGARAFVPALWRWEVVNALLGIEKRKRATQAEISRQLVLLQSCPIDIDEAASDLAWTATHELGRKHGLTGYDAAYLELSVRRGLPLATLDVELQNAAKAEGVAVISGK